METRLLRPIVGGTYISDPGPDIELRIPHFFQYPSVV
jgi:hypothetical protein